MTEAELVTRLATAGERPLLDALTVRRGKQKGERYANVRPGVRARLEWIGRERSLTYKTLVLTGLRKGELASLTVGQLHLDGAVCFASLDAADEKNRQGSEITLRDDLAEIYGKACADRKGLYGRLFLFLCCGPYFLQMDFPATIGVRL